MHKALATLIVRKFGDWLERWQPPDDLTETELMVQNVSKGTTLFAHHHLPLPRTVIRDAFQTLLAGERDPERIERLRVGLPFLEEDPAGCGDCVVPLERALAGVLNQFDELHNPWDKFTKTDVEVAIKDYLRSL